jgi:hypothetical protein
MGAFPTAEEPEGILLQLVVQHWHPGFGLYAPALQHELMDGLKRFDPHATPSKYHVHWKFSLDCGCPHTSLPDSSFWAASPATADSPKPALQAQSTPVPPPKFDLPNSPDDDDDLDNGFAATQMHDMH